MIKRCFSASHLAVAATAASISALFGSISAWAGPSDAVDWQLGLQEPVTEVGRAINEFHDLTNIIIILVAVFVMLLMGFVLFRFRESANPVPSKATHNAVLEFAWTAVPILILLFIAIPSFKLLFLQYSYPKPDLTIKVTGYQWYWGNSYPDQGGFEIDQVIVRDADLLTTALGDAAFEAKYGSLTGTALTKVLYKDAKPLWKKSGKLRMLATDNALVVPVNKVVHVLITAEDVLHNWTIPAFGSKVDAVPGRVTTTWFKAEKKGTYYGQCSELCGKDHSAMPITVQVVDQPVFDAWVAAMKAEKTDDALKILQQATLNDKALKTVASARPSAR